MFYNGSIYTKHSTEKLKDYSYIYIYMSSTQEAEPEEKNTVNKSTKDLNIQLQIYK